MEEPDTTFTMNYPLFIICKDDNDLAFVKGKAESSVILGLPVFTDHDGAVAFRDKFFADWRFAMIPDPTFFAQLLKTLTDKVFCVMIDPYEMGLRTRTIPINVMIEQLERD